MFEKWNMLQTWYRQHLKIIDMPASGWLPATLISMTFWFLNSISFSTTTYFELISFGKMFSRSDPWTYGIAILNIDFLTHFFIFTDQQNREKALAISRESYLWPVPSFGLQQEVSILHNRWCKYVEMAVILKDHTDKSTKIGVGADFEQLETSHHENSW